MATIEINDIKYNSMAFAKVVKDEENKQLIYVAPSGRRVIREFETVSDLESAYEDATIGAGGGLVQADSYSDFPDRGDAGSIYIAKDTGQEYYWDKATETYVKVGTAGRTGVYAASVDLNSTIGAATTVNKTDLTILVNPTVAYSEGSEVVGANATHGLITASTENNVTVKTIPDNTIDSFDQVEDEAHLPQTGQENILYYLKDSDTFRVWDNTNQAYIKPEYLTTSGVNGTNIGTTSNTAINLDTLSKGKHIFTNHNYRGNIFYYKYTDVNGTVQSANIYMNFSDSGGLAPSGSDRANFNIIEIDMIHTLDELSSLSPLYDPVAMITFYYENKNTSYSTGFDEKYIIIRSANSIWASRVSMYIDEYYLNTKYKQKQDKLVSGTNIKTINNTSLLGEGDITIGSSAPIIKQSSSSSTDVDKIDLRNLEKGKTIYYNYFTKSSCAYRSADVGGYTVINLIDYSYTQIGSNSCTWGTLEIDWYYSWDEIISTVTADSVVGTFTFYPGTYRRNFNTVTPSGNQIFKFTCLYSGPSSGNHYFNFYRIVESTQTSCIDNKLDTMNTTISEKEDSSNKVTSLSNASTDAQYPSAKCVYDLIGDVESLLSEV